MTKHQLLMIHGMGESNSENEYGELEKRIRNKLYDPERFEFVRVEWQSITHNAEEKIYSVCLPNLNFVRKIEYVGPVRYFMTFYVGDIIAYSAEPASKNGIRKKVWSQIKGPCGTGPYSILAHSLGSIIAFDYLFKLFVKKTFLWPGSAKVSSRKTLDRYTGNFRHMFTFGSPIGLFMLRQGKLWLTEEPFGKIINPVPTGHEWLNFYDKQDAVTYPLTDLFALNSANIGAPIRDIVVDTGDLIANSHTDYWFNDDMADQIADVLNMNP